MSHKITKELLNQMIEARKRGNTFAEIEKKFKVSRWTTIHYLSDIIIEPLWKKYEEKVRNVLTDYGFIDIIDLNIICPASHFDILATKDNEKWLIDVQISEPKCLPVKTTRKIPEYRCVILRITHDLKNHKLEELQKDIIYTLYTSKIK